MSSRTWLRAAVAVLAVALLALPALAQTTSTTGAIEGRVTDVNGAPIEGAKVTATGGRAPITATTNVQGYYLFSNLPPGDYSLRIEKQGFSTIVQKDVPVNIATRRNVPFVLTEGQVENVTVTADAPLIDQKSTTTGGTFTIEKYVGYIPTGRTFSDSFALAPGVVGGGGTGAGNYSISGSSGLENSYLVDGVNITNTGYGGIGSYNIVYGSLGSGVTFDFLEEIQVKTGGIDAEYGQATGGVINTVVKSGTNNLQGSVGAFVSPKSGLATFKDRTLSVGAVTLQDENKTDLAGSIGGPIVKDKLFYYVAYNPVKTKTTADIDAIALPTNFSDVLDPLNPDAPRPGYAAPVPGQPGTYTFPASVLGAQERERKNNNYAAKLTWYAHANHRIELSAFGDPSRGPAGPQNFDSDFNEALRNLDYGRGGGQSSIKYGADNYSLKYDAVFTPTFFLNAQIGRHDGQFRETNVLDFIRVRDRRQQLAFLTGAADNGAIWLYGGTGFVSNADDVNTQYKLSATWVLGNHELKGGVGFDKIEYTDDQAYSGPQTDFLIPIDGDRDGNTTLGAPICSGNDTTDCYLSLTSTSGTLIDRRADTHFRSVRARFYPTPPPTKTNDTSIFLSDNWAVTPRWNLRLGVRASEQKIEGSGGFSLPFSRDPELHSLVLDARTYNPNEYTFDWSIAPRLGVTWDISGDGRTKAYANLARYFERIPNDLAIRALSNEVGISRYRWREYDFATGTPSNPQVVSTNVGDTILFQGLDTTCIIGQDCYPGGKTKLPYVDEVVLGYQHELSRDLSFEVRAIYREQGRALEDVQFNSIESIQNYYYGYSGPYGGPTGYPVDPFPGFAPAPFGPYILANPGDNTPEDLPKATRKYEAVEFIVNKRFADNWLFYGTARWSRLRGNYEGLYRNDNTQSDPNITSLFDFPNSPLMSGQFFDGPLNNDRPYTLRLNGSYQFDAGVTLGATMSWASGTPRTSLLAHPNYQNSGEIPGLDPIYFWWQDTAAGGCGDPSAFTPMTGTTDQFLTANSDPALAICNHFLYDYTKVKRGNLGRTAKELTFDTHVQWNKKLKVGTFQLAATVFNLLNSQKATNYNDTVEATAGIPDPDYKQVLTYQYPRQIRLMARWTY